MVTFFILCFMCQVNKIKLTVSTDRVRRRTCCSDPSRGNSLKEKKKKVGSYVIKVLAGLHDVWSPLSFIHLHPALTQKLPAGQETTINPVCQLLCVSESNSDKSFPC